MKKRLLFLLLAFTASATMAQNMYSLVYQDNENYIDLRNTMQQRDGDFVIYTYISEDTGTNISLPLGHMFHKLSPITLTVTDSLLVEDTVRDYTCLLARNPHGEGNIKAAYEYHEDCDSTFLRISFFSDNDLHTNPEDDIVTPVCEGHTMSGTEPPFIDRWGDLIMKYFKVRPNEVYDEYIARFGIDGTLKHQALLNENSNGMGKLREFRKLPLQYYQFINASADNLAIIVIDSLFQKNTVILNKILREESINTINTEYEYLNFCNISEVEVISIDGNQVLVAAPYVNDTNFSHLHAKFGVAVAKYDMRTMQLKDYIVFDEQSTQFYYGKCVGLKMMTDGTVYSIYQKRVQEPDFYIVKMDTDLNVEWERFCKTGDIVIYPEWGLSFLYDDGSGNEKGIAWSWYALKTDNDKIGLAHFILNHDATVGINEAGIEVRPYTFYPNPVKDQIHLQYSPDVQPKAIELYDLQGHLLHTQSNDLECVNLQGFASGQYLMKVFLEGGKVFSEKVAKR